jgi:hypothetical protein
MSQLKLYEISELLRGAMDAAMERVDPDTGEIPADWSEFLDAVEMERNEKCCAIGCLIREQLTEADAISAEAKRLTDRARATKATAERLKSYLATAIQPGEKIADSRVAISWRASESVSVAEVLALPEKYQRVSVEANKTEIKDALKKGEDVPGCALVKNQNIQIK